MKRTLDNWARRRYALMYNAILAMRGTDAHGLAVHLQDAMPRVHENSPVFASGVYPADVNDSPELRAALGSNPAHRLQAAASDLGGWYFWVTDTDAGKQLAVYVVPVNPEKDA